MFKENKWLRTDKVISEELSIFEVGYEDVHPRAPYQYDQLDYYLIHFIVQGEGLFFINDELHQLSRGDGFMIPPHTDNNYYPLVGNPWSYRWIGVRGSAADKIFKAAGLGTGNFVYHHENIRQLDQLFAGVYDYFANDHLYGALGRFYEIINLLGIDHDQRNRLDVNCYQQYVLDATAIMHQHYQESDLRVSDIATTVQVERTYLYKLFMHYLGISPKDYLIQYRLNQATHLLRHSSLSIAQIANQTGFSDYSQFSKMFSKYRHVSPSEFRKQFDTEQLAPQNWLS